jgi:hypothetical protein
LLRFVALPHRAQPTRRIFAFFAAAQRDFSAQTPHPRTATRRVIEACEWSANVFTVALAAAIARPQHEYDCKSLAQNRPDS